MVRYEINFTSIDNEVYTGEISNPSYTGVKQTIQGDFSRSSDLSGDITQPIQIKAVNINLLATIENPLNDIFNEDDRFWLFTLYRNNQKKFQGYVSTDQMEQSFTSNKWLLNFDALGHLSYLEDIAYFDEFGLPYTGVDSVLNIIKKCIDKGFNDNDPKFGIITSHHLEHNGTEIFKNSYLDQSLFYDEEGEAEDCKTILEDILKSLGCFITQYNLNFVIMSVRNFVRLKDSPVAYDSHSSEGVYQATLNFTPISSSILIGSEIDNLETYHANSNQRYIKNNLYNSFKTRFELKPSEELLENPNIETTSATAPPWVLGPGATALNDYVQIQAVQSILATNVQLTSEWINIIEGDRIELTVNALFSKANNEPSGEIGMRYDLIYQDINNVQLATFPYFINPETETVERKDIIRQFSAFPEDGRIRVEIQEPYFQSRFNATDYVRILNVNIKPYESIVEAFEYTAKREDKKVGQIPDVYEIRFNNNPSLLVKNIYLDSTLNSIPFYTNKYNSIDLVLGEELSLMFLELFSINYLEFSGSVRNNKEFFVKEINNLGTHFVVVQEEKDLKRNVSSLNLIEVSSTSLDPADYTLETVRVFKNAIKPTIVS